MLLKNAHPNPLIHLRGVNKEILKCVIEFMYLGQTEVPNTSQFARSVIISIIYYLGRPESASRFYERRKGLRN